jgi:hypothetical protein
LKGLDKFLLRLNNHILSILLLLLTFFSQPADTSAAEDEDWDLVEEGLAEFATVGGGKEVFISSTSDGFTAVTTLPERELSSINPGTYRDLIGYMKMSMNSWLLVLSRFKISDRFSTQHLEISEEAIHEAEIEENEHRKLNLLVSTVALCRYATDSLVASIRRSLGPSSILSSAHRQLGEFQRILPDPEYARDDPDVWAADFITAVPRAVESLEGALDVSRDSSVNLPGQYILIVAGIRDVLNRITASLKMVITFRSAS